MEFPSIFSKRVSLCVGIKLRTLETGSGRLDQLQELNFTSARCLTERTCSNLLFVYLATYFTPDLENQLRKN